MERNDGRNPGLAVLDGIGDQVEKDTFQGLGVEPYDRKHGKVYMELRARLLDQTSNGVLHLIEHLHEIGLGQRSFCGIYFLKGIDLGVHRIYQTIGGHNHHGQYFLGLQIIYFIEIDQVDQRDEIVDRGP